MRYTCRKLRAMFRLTIYLVLLSISISSIAQDSIPMVELEEAVVISSKVDLTPQETGRDVIVIKAEDIEKLPVNSLDELFRYLPGVEISTRGGFGAQADFSIRGATFNQVLVLIDGVRMNDALTGHFNSNIPVHPSEIYQIEVIKGAEAALYGADAVGGVINIITKAFTRRFYDDNISVDLKGGEYGFILASGGINYLSKSGRFGVTGGYNYRMAEGQELGIDTLTQDFTIQTGSLALTYRRNKFDMAIRSAYDDRLNSAVYYYTRSTFDRSREQVMVWWNQAQIRYAFDENNTTTVRLGYRHSRDSFLFNPLFPANIHTIMARTISAEHRWRFSSRSDWVFGVESNHYDIESTDRGDHGVSHEGAFIRWHYTPVKDFGITATARVDYDTAYDLEFSPQLSLVYFLEDGSIYGSIGRSIRSADFTERYNGNKLAMISPGRNVGNPGLDVESAWNAELGSKLFLTSNTTLDLLFFGRKSEQLIDWILTLSDEIPNNDNLQSGEYYFYASNLSEVTTVGIESSILHSRNYGNSKLDYRIGYAYVHSYNDEGLVSKYIANHSNILLNGSVTFSNRILRLSLNGIHKHRTSDLATAINAELKSSYFVMNGKFGINVYKEKLWLTGEVINIFDEEYSDILGAEQPGRWIIGGLSARF